ncbi:hypothetical protein PG994_014536 [Apiospora phragmitis]|uniref:Uncharacterized protein n=1 Tax=Apiospora phragmitis TaxID=2905665 RepID=A0ABR1T4L4_9PEZI
MGSTSTQYEALAEQIESILQDPSAQVQDERTCRRLAAAARKLGVALEFPMETLRRFGYAHLQLPMALIGVETGLFAALAAEPRPFTSAELADKTAVNLRHPLKARLIRS